MSVDFLGRVWYCGVLRKGAVFMAKKRANGEGNIRKRKDGRWEGRYTAGYDPATGKRIIKNVLGKTQAEVKEKLAVAMDDVKDLDVARSDNYTVGSWLTNWYTLYAKPNVRVSTAEYYRRSIELHVNPRIGDIKLNKLTGRDLQKLYQDLCRKNKVILTFRPGNDRLNHNRLLRKGWFIMKKSNLWRRGKIRKETAF